MSSLATGSLDALYHEVSGLTDLKVLSITPQVRDEVHRAFKIDLEGGAHAIAHVAGVNQFPSFFESEIATIHFIRSNTSIPVPDILAREEDATDSLGPHVILMHPQGTSLDTVFFTLSAVQQDAIIAQIARWTLELLQNQVSAIGNFHADPGCECKYKIGPILQLPFLTEGRAQLDLDRGPYSTARAYLLACTQRELDCARTLFSQETSSSYQRDLEECRVQVETSMMLLSDLIQRCKGLDDDDPELAPFALDIHGMTLRNFIVASDEPSKILCVTGWEYISTKPLWQCARLPCWLTASMRDDAADGDKMRLSAIFRHVFMNAEGSETPLRRALDGNDTRCALHDLCEYDAFKDGFLLSPTLQSLAATLPGEEDLAGLAAILDPSTVTGRVARISLLTSGFSGDTMSLAFAGDRHDDRDEVKNSAPIRDPSTSLPIIV